MWTREKKKQFKSGMWTGHSYTLGCKVSQVVWFWVDLICFPGDFLDFKKKVVNTSRVKAWTDIDRFSTIWKSDLLDNKKIFFLNF